MNLRSAWVRTSLVVATLTSFATAGVTTRISVDNSGNEANGMSEGVISADGRHLAFWSDASNLVSGDTNNAHDVFRKDLTTGEVVRVSVDSQGQQTDGDSYLNVAISADGMVVAFTSYATNLVPGDTNGTVDVFAHDLHTGATTRASVDSSGQEADNVSFGCALSGDGHTVAFASWATNLVAQDTNHNCDVFCHDLQTGVTERVSVNSAGQQAFGFSTFPALSRDGQLVAFESDARLVRGEHGQQIYVHDRASGMTTLASVDSNGVPPSSGDSINCSLSDDGRLVAFESNADSLVDGDHNHYGSDIFVHDRATGLTRLTSIDRDGRQFHVPTWRMWGAVAPRISGDGRFVTYVVMDQLLYSAGQVYATELATGLTSLVSVSSQGERESIDRYNPTYPRVVSLSRDGQLFAFCTNARNLVSDKTTFFPDIFLHRRAAVSLTGVPKPSNPVSFAIDAGEPGDLALVLLSASGTTGFPITPGGLHPGLLPDAALLPGDSGDAPDAPSARWIPLSLDVLTITGLSSLPFLSARIDAFGHGSTRTLVFPSVSAGLTFYAAAITLEWPQTIESVTSPITIVSQ